VFKFTLRDLFWLTVVVAILCGWWLQHRRSEELQNQLVVENAKHRADSLRYELQLARELHKRQKLEDEKARLKSDLQQAAPHPPLKIPFRREPE
jgi:C4-dicarboxylate-specific signal transduction histidine kinase